MFTRDAISVFLHGLNYVVFKMSAFSTYACFESWMPLVNGCVNCTLFNAVPKIEINKQIKTHETDAIWLTWNILFSLYECKAVQLTTYVSKVM